MDSKVTLYSYWDAKGTDDPFPAEDALTEDQLRSLLGKLISTESSIDLVSMSARHQETLATRSVILMNPLLLSHLHLLSQAGAGLDNVDVSSRLELILENDVFNHLKIIADTPFPTVLFPVKHSDDKWCLGVMTKPEDDEATHFVLVGSETDAISSEYISEIRAFTANINTLLRTGPNSSLKVHHAFTDINAASDDNGVFMVLMIGQLLSSAGSQEMPLSMPHWTCGDYILSLTDGQSEMEVMDVDYVSDVKNLRQMWSSRRESPFVSSIKNSTLRVQLTTESSMRFAENFDGNRLIFSRKMKSDVEELDVSEEFRAMFLNDLPFEDYLKAQKKGMTHSQITPWNYEFLTQYHRGIPIDHSISRAPTGFERLDVKKSEYLEFMAKTTNCSKSDLESILQNMVRCRRLDRKLVDLRYSYLRSTVNHSIILKSKTISTPNKKSTESLKRKIDEVLIGDDSTKIFKRTIHPYDLLYYCYYAHACSTNHGSVKASFDSVKNVIDNITRDMIWFTCSRCKSCAEGKTKDNGTLSELHAEKPFQRLHVQLVDMTSQPSLDKDGQTWKWIFALRDEYSQFVWLFALRDKKLKSIKYVLEEFLLRNTFPGEIQSSNAAEILKGFVDKSITISGRPSSHYDSLNSVIVQHLRSFMEESKDVNWSTYLAKICREVNHSMNRHINAIPAAALFSKMAVNLEKRRFQIARSFREVADVGLPGDGQIDESLIPEWQRLQGDGDVASTQLIVDPET